MEISPISTIFGGQDVRFKSHGARLWGLYIQRLRVRGVGFRDRQSMTCRGLQGI